MYITAPFPAKLPNHQSLRLWVWNHGLSLLPNAEPWTFVVAKCQVSSRLQSTPRTSPDSLTKTIISELATSVESRQLLDAAVLVSFNAELSS
jgi:hypothetical protein